MAKSSATCFNFITCANGFTENDSKKDHGSESQEKDSKEKRRWSFRKRAAQHRVLSTTVEIEQSSSSKDKHEQESVCDQNKQIMHASAGKSTLSDLMDKPSETTEAAVTFKATGTPVSTDRSIEVSAVIDIQAAIRAYLACREFYRLKCIVSLQAHVRGHLVRKQAAITLRCVRAIVRLQALVRARRVRSSEEGLAIREKLEYIRRQNGSKGNGLERNVSNASMNNDTFLSEKLFSNGFANQLLKAVPKTDSLCMEYDPDHCNSGWKWLERWMAAAPWESGLSVQANNTAKCLNKSEHAHILEARAENPRHILIKESNSMLGPVIVQPEVESEKTAFSLTKRSDLTSTPDSVSDQLHSIKESSNSILDSLPDQLSEQLILIKESNSMLGPVIDQPEVESEKTAFSLTKRSDLMSTPDSVSDQIHSIKKSSNSILDSLPDRLSEQLKQVSTLDLTKDSVETVDSNCSSREGSMLILDYMPTSASAPSKHETNNEKGNDSLRNMQSSNYDSVSNQLSIPLRNTSDPSLESVPIESNTEPDNPQLTLRKITNSTMDSLSNQPKLEGENHIRDSTKASNSTFDSVSCQIEPAIENSMHLRRVSDSTLDSVSEQLSMEISDDSSSTMNSLDQLKDEAENFYCNLSKVSNTTRDSVLGQHSIESENLQSNLSIVSNPATISVPDQTEVNVESPNCKLEKALNVASGSISVQVEAEKSTHSFRKTFTSDMDSVLNEPKVEAENSECTSSSVVDSVSVQPGNSSDTNLDSFSDQLQPQVEGQNGNYSLGNDNYTLEKALNVAFDSTSLQVEAEKSTDSFRNTSTLDMDSVSNQPKVEAENNNCTLSSVMDSVSFQPGNVLSSNLGSASVQFQPRVETENGNCSLDKLSNTTFDSTPFVQGTSPIHQSTSSPESNEPENASAQQGAISCGDSIPTKHKRLESPIKSSFENSAVSRRRSSFGSRKAGHSENDSQGSPSLPNYMAATVSAKAKSRALNSQDSSPDVLEYGTARRRNSFPASNGNQHTGSPQTQRSSPKVQRTTRGNGVHSPRDSTEKLKQIEWRR